MLTRDLLRFELKEGKALPRWVKPTPAVARLAEQLLQHYQTHCGQTRAYLDEHVGPILHGSRSQMLARGFMKLIADACEFTEPAYNGAIRAEVFDAAAALRRDGLPQTSEEMRRQVAQRCGLQADTVAANLYADLPQAATLQSAPQWSVSMLCDRYNIAQAQGLILGARELQAVIFDDDRGLKRRILKALRFHRLLASVNKRPDGMGLTISGPGSVLQQANRYGLQLAQFIPHLATAQRWQFTAQVTLPKQQGAATFFCDHSMPLRGHSQYLAYTPPELEALATKIAAKHQAWSVHDQVDSLQLPGGEIIIPDIALESDIARWRIELFHRWHGSALRRRLGQIAEGLATDLIVGVDRSLAKNDMVTELLAHPRVALRSFLFRDYPTPTAINKLIKDMAQMEAY